MNTPTPRLPSKYKVQVKHSRDIRVMKQIKGTINADNLVLVHLTKRKATSTTKWIASATTKLELKLLPSTLSEDKLLLTVAKR